MPLEVAAAKEIALSVGLAERDADVVAAYTEGYPGLALTLAKAIRYGGADDSLIERVRGRSQREAGGDAVVEGGEHAHAASAGKALLDDTCAKKAVAELTRD